jgi:ribosomal protein S18 acetylase RimI-like enzyme
MQTSIRNATLNDRALIRSISERTWPSTYGHIISQEQIDFMLDWMYSDASLEEQINKGHQFFIATYKNEDIGFCSVSKETDGHKLNKLYILPNVQGSGVGTLLLNKAVEIAKMEGSTSLFLQVNKHNNAYDFYIKKGFTKESEFKFDIGNGFYMDDYVMRLQF